MSLLFGKKENEVINLFHKHLSRVKVAVDTTYTLIQIPTSERESVVKKVRELETEADSIRRDTETMMYSGAFLAQSRGDMLGLVEAVDRIANKAEFVSDLLYLQDLIIPESLKEKYEKEFAYSIKAYDNLQKAAETLFDDTKKVKEYVLKVEKWENTGDGAERDLIRSIYQLDIDLAWKMQLRELAFQIGDIADRSEDASDRIEIILLKANA